MRFLQRTTAMPANIKTEFRGQSPSRSFSNCLGADAETVSPVTSRHRNSVKRDVDAIAFVAALLPHACPSAVHRPVVCDALFAVAARIVSCVIYSVNAVLCRRSLSNIGQEGLKRISPPVANCYATVDVISTFLSAWFRASCDYSAPGAMLRGRRQGNMVGSHDVALLNRVALRSEPTGGCTPDRLASFYQIAA